MPALAGRPEAAYFQSPRLLARRGIEEPPLGLAYWGNETRVLVPLAAGPQFVNPLTGEHLTVERGALPLALAFASFPVALLVSGPERIPLGSRYRVR